MIYQYENCGKSYRELPFIFLHDNMNEGKAKKFNVFCLLTNKKKSPKALISLYVDQGSTPTWNDLNFPITMPKVIF